MAPWVGAAEGEAMERVFSKALERLSSQPWLPVWKGARVGGAKLVAQNPAQLYQLGLKPVWVVEVTRGGTPAGYFMLEQKSPYRWVEFAVDDAEPFANGFSQSMGVAGVPNLQQFPVPGKMAAQVASGCVPTAGANLIGYWAGCGFSWWLDPGAREPSLQAAALRLRGALPLREFPDEAGYTDEKMPLTGSHALGLARALEKDALRYHVPLRARVERFDRFTLEEEIRLGRPLVVCGETRLPHKPDLSWGHALTAVGWSEWEGEFFVMVRDNFYPTQKSGAVRWLRSDALSEMVIVSPE